ncbi:MAG: LacI family DNA-binding transcriptional regulator [Spirochaetes bacterium]|nr:LacI family DNA-binding transcriptional regulator [Spirochaetota bacterium]
MNPTIVDVARVAGVSTATVSRVINGISRVEPVTKKRVEAAIEKLRYRPNILARGLMKSRTDSVGILVTHIVNPYHMSIVHALERRLAAHGVFCYLCNSGDDPEQEDRYARELIRRAVDSLIVIEGAHSDSPDAVMYSTLAGDVPLILVNEHVALDIRAHIVRCEQETGIREAFAILAASGRRRVVLLNGTGHYSFDLKRRLLSEFVESNGLDPADNPVITISCPNDTESVHEAAGIAAALVRGPNPPDAIFAANDMMAAGALQGLLETGVSVPDDVAVVGVDDVIIARITRPKLSSVSLRTEEIGRETAETWVRIRDGVLTAPARVVVHSAFIERETT